jgi:hypothetical protein
MSNTHRAVMNVIDGTRRKRAIVKPTPVQLLQLRQFGFTGLDDDDTSSDFVFAFLPNGWMFVRTGQRGPDGMGEVVRFLDHTGRCRVKQVEHLRAFTARNTLTIMPIES